MSCTAVINRRLTAVLLTRSQNFILRVLNFVKTRFFFDFPRADERSIMHYGSVDKVCNKMHVNEGKVYCKLYLYFGLFS